MSTTRRRRRRTCLTATLATRRCAGTHLSSLVCESGEREADTRGAVCQRCAHWPASERRGGGGGRRRASTARAVLATSARPVASLLTLFFRALQEKADAEAPRPGEARGKACRGQSRAASGATAERAGGGCCSGRDRRPGGGPQIRAAEACSTGAGDVRRRPGPQEQGVFADEALLPYMA
jgi:hypothetical protein